MVEGPTEPPTETPLVERRDTMTCPGCGGRNELSAHICEWCGRPFVAQPKKIPRAVVGLAIVAGAAMVVALAIVLTVAAVLSRVASEPSAPAPSPPPAVEAARAEPTAAGAEPAAAGSEYVRIANTDNLGAFIRTEPREGAQRIGVAVPERRILLVIGPDRPDPVVANQTWRNVQDETGRQGWMLARYLVPSDVGF